MCSFAVFSTHSGCRTCVQHASSILVTNTRLQET
jgi:hypothetical protein